MDARERFLATMTFGNPDLWEPPGVLEAQLGPVEEMWTPDMALPPNDHTRTAGRCGQSLVGPFRLTDFRSRARRADYG